MGVIACITPAICHIDDVVCYDVDHALFHVLHVIIEHLDKLASKRQMSLLSPLDKLPKDCFELGKTASIFKKLLKITRVAFINENCGNVMTRRKGE